MTKPTELRRRRRLQDLYARGVMVELDDGSDPENPVQVWIQKITPLEQKQAIDKAHSIRARIKATKDKDDQDSLRVRLLGEAQITGIFDSREIMIEFVEGERVRKARLSHESEIAENPEWSDNDYLNGLREAWDESLYERYILDSDDPEANQVYSELQRYVSEVEEKMEGERRSLFAEYDNISDNELKNRIINFMIDGEADEAWLTEFRKWQLFYALRDPDSHGDRYFESREEIDTLDPQASRLLFEKFDELMVDPIEGKD